MDLLNQDEVLVAIHGFSPWWKAQATEEPRLRRLAFMSCRRYLSDLTLRCALLLSVPRASTVRQRPAATLGGTAQRLGQVTAHAKTDVAFRWTSV